MSYCYFWLIFYLMLNLFEQVGHSAKAWVEWKRFSEKHRKSSNFWKNLWRNLPLAFAIVFVFSNCALFWGLHWQVSSVLSKILQHFRETYWLSLFVPSQQFELTNSSCANYFKFSLTGTFRGSLNGRFIEKETPTTLFPDKSQKHPSLGVP